MVFLLGFVLEMVFGGPHEVILIISITVLPMAVSGMNHDIPQFWTKPSYLCGQPWADIRRVNWVSKIHGLWTPKGHLKKGITGLLKNDSMVCMYMKYHKVGIRQHRSPFLGRSDSRLFFKISVSAAHIISWHATSEHKMRYLDADPWLRYLETQGYHLFHEACVWWLELACPCIHIYI